MLSRCTGASAYLVNRLAAQAYVEGLLPMQLPYDHVLADMLRRLGAQVAEVIAAFEPESGAYGGGGHHHSHDDTLRYRPVIHSFDGVRK